MLRILDRLEEILIATLIGAATLLIFVAVVHRYAFGVPFLFPYMQVDVAIARVDTRSCYRIVLFGLLCGALFTAVIGSFGARFVYLMAQTGQVSPDLELPAWIVYLAIPCGSYLMCFRFLQVAYAFARTGELPHHDAAQVEGVEQEPPITAAAAVAAAR
jgi:C4-dicarboxylate transporter DctQ subunit